MRLLRIENGGDFSLVERVGNNIPQYAILSHTWGRDEEEVTFKDLENGIGNTKVGYHKIRFCGKQAAKDGLRYFWVDTCCIDKSSSAELQEAINSMFRWYQHAAKCYAIFSDVSISSSMGINLSPQQILAIQSSRWFTRSWTLQELLAPTSVEFFSAEGKRLGDRMSLVQEIHNITGISIRALQGSPLSQFNVDERMSWAKRREAKREEDAAYSLLGIFNVNMPLIYGEGRQRAFIRLYREIEQSSTTSQLTRSMEEAQIDKPMSSSLDQRERKRKILKCLKASPYQDRKDRNPDRVLGTCDWFVSHELFRDWQESKLSTMLWVSADPGCGKSVLAKHLVDSVLPTTKSRTVCYFFFKDDFEDQRNVVSALCCILHQLFMQKPILLSDTILDQFDTEGEKFTSTFGELWQTLINAAEDKNAGEIVCLLDALDECEDQGRAQLSQKLCQLYGTRRNFNLKFLLTSRPYGEIRRGFQPLKIPGLPVIHLSGESDVEMEKISHEIDAFIGAKVQDIGALLRLTYDEQDLLLRQLMRVPHRTYLWVYLTLDLIKKDIDIEKSGIVKATSQLPQTVDEAYDRVLSKSRNPEKAKRILHIILAAARPLTLSEMALALALQESHRSYDDLNLRSKDRFYEEVRDACGLFVTVIKSKIYLLHQTAKEFLVQDDSVNSPEGMRIDLKWKYSLRPRESHRILTEICIWYLLLAEIETHPLAENGSLSQYLESHIFLDYSAKHWAAHLRELQIEIQDAMTQSILNICDASSGRCLTWFRVYWTSTNTDFPQGFTTLMITSYFGLSTAVKRLLKMDGINLNCQDHTYRRSALSWAAGNGFGVVVRRLIKVVSIGPKYLKLPFRNGAEVDSVDRDGRTPLFYAVWNGNLAVVKLLIKAGAWVDSIDRIGGTPLSYAIVYGREEAIKLLLKRGSQVDLEQDISKRLLFSAAREGHEAVVRLLLEAGKVDADSKDIYGQTPLHWAAEKGHEAVVRLLLETGKVDADSKDKYGQTPLQCAAGNGHEAVVRLLLETGKVDADSKDNSGWTPLQCAAKNGHEAVVRLLLETGKVDADSKDNSGWTPLHWAAENGHEAVVRLLLETGKVDADLKDNYGWTPLQCAAKNGHEAVVRLLLETGKVDANLKDKYGWTPLQYAAQNRHEAVVKLLLETG